jgi:hypothetical protein
MRTKNFQPTQYSPNRFTVTGLLAVAALAGMVVTRKNAAADEVELADGKAGYFLDRDVVANKAALQTLIEANELRPDKDGFEYPYVAGGQVTAGDFEEIEIEGSALDSSMDGTVAVGDQVTTASGKIALLTDSEAEECLGIVRKIVDDINGSGKRFTIQIVRAPKNIPAA